MADLNFDDFDGGRAVAPHVARVRRALNMAGAALSLALLAGLAVWSYRLTTYDPLHVPMVQAATKAMRMAPDNPGGAVTAHQGLAVNDVAASGAATARPDTIALAPRAAELHDEDVPGLARSAPPAEPVSLLESRVTTLATSPEVGQAAPVTVALGETPPLPADAVVPAAGPVAPPPDAGAVSDAPGLTIAATPRPPARPVALTRASAAAPAAQPTYAEVDAASIAPGTRLVQLGAFDDDAGARAEWVRLLARFGDLMDGRALVVEAAQSGGRTFFRLRAYGFADEDDARRFCSALVSEDAACIPVRTR